MPINPFVGAALIGGGANLLSGFFGASSQSSTNMKMAKFQEAAQNRLIDKMNAYNTPAMQMARYKEAGLNPHLIYGQGSPGNQTSPGSAPEFRPPDIQGAYSNAGAIVGGMAQQVAQLRLIDSQTEATNARTRQTYALTQLNELQSEVMKRNPMLDDGAFKAVIDGLKSTAELKGEQAAQAKIRTMVDEASQGHIVSKLYKEVELLDQRYRLTQLDESLRAEVLKSKQFQNAILEVQKRFLADGDVGPAQIYQFIQLLLMKLL